MKLADYCVQYLANLGIKKVFVVYGAACGDLIDAFSRVKETEYVAVMHEQAGAFAAETYAKVSGGLGAAIATSGPGGTNLLTGIANAYYDSVPCIFITGQINSKFLRPNPEVRQTGFQENDIVAMAKPITKMAVMVREPEMISSLLYSAASIAKLGRPGPILLDIPVDVQKADITPIDHPMLSVTNFARLTGAPCPESEAKAFLDDLFFAKRPVMLVGGGARGAIKEVRELAEKLRIPTFPTWNAIDIITSDFPYYGGRVGTYGGPGRNFAIQNCDLLLCIGTRISGRITGGNVKSFAREAKKYIVDIDEAVLEYQPVEGIRVNSDAKVFITTLLEEILKEKFVFHTRDKEYWLSQVLNWREEYQPCLKDYYSVKGYVHPYVFMKVLSEELEPGDVVVGDCGGNVAVMFQTFETKYGQRVLSSHGNSPMGYSFAGAMGAGFVPKDLPCLPGGKSIKRVICLIGDGGFNMNIQELQTIKNYGVDIKTFIMNNHCYGITRQYQETNFEGRYLACGPEGYNPPNFIPIVKAYGIATETIKNHSELRRKIRKVIQHPGAIVCDVDMGNHQNYEPRIFGWKTPIEDAYPYLPREEFRGNMIIEPVEGWEKPSMPGKVEGTGLG